MKTLVEMPINGRLPRSITLLVLFLAVFMGMALYRTAHVLQRDTAVESLQTLARDQGERVEGWFAATGAQLASEASSPHGAATIRNFRLSIAVDGGTLAPARAVRVTGHPNPADRRDALADAGDGTAYSAVHKAAQPRFARTLSEIGYRDLLLFDPDGNLIYSVTKEDDSGRTSACVPAPQAVSARRAARPLPPPRAMS